MAPVPVRRMARRRPEREDCQASPKQVMATTRRTRLVRARTSGSLVKTAFREDVREEG